MPWRRVAYIGLLIAALLPMRATAQSPVWNGDRAVLEGTPTRIPLRPLEAAEAKELLAEPQSRRLTLVLRGLTTNVQPGIGYWLFLNLPPSETPSLADAGYIGSINFFGMPANTESGHPRAVSFDISHVMARLAKLGRLDERLTLTIAPSGSPEPNAHPAVDQIAIFES
jgi:hypothetical protein